MSGLSGTIAQHMRQAETLYHEAVRTETMLRAALAQQDFKASLYALRTLEELSAGAVREGLHAKLHVRNKDVWRDLQRLRDVCNDAAAELLQLRNVEPALNGLDDLGEGDVWGVVESHANRAASFAQRGLTEVEGGNCGNALSTLISAKDEEAKARVIGWSDANELQLNRTLKPATTASRALRSAFVQKCMRPAAVEAPADKPSWWKRFR